MWLKFIPLPPRGTMAIRMARADFYRRKLSSAAVQAIRASPDSARAIAPLYGVSRQCIDATSVTSRNRPMISLIRAMSSLMVALKASNSCPSVIGTAS